MNYPQNQLQITISFLESKCNIAKCNIDHKENIEEVEKADMILNILLNFPEELNLKVKPSAIQEYKVFTLDERSQPVLKTRGICFQRLPKEVLYVQRRDVQDFL